MTDPQPSETSDFSLRSDAEELYQQLTKLLRIHQFRDRNRTCYRDLSVTQCHALAVLVESDGLSLKQLATALSLDKSSASRLVTTLTRKGYVTRAVARRDRRAIRLSATASGRAVHQAVERELIDDYQALLEGFDPDVRLAMIKLISRLVRAVVHRFCKTAPVTASLPRLSNWSWTDPALSSPHADSELHNAGSVVLRVAVDGDLEAVKELLAAEDLPVGGLEEFFGENYVIAQLHGRVVAAAGMEVYGHLGLIRSVIVAKTLRGTGLGQWLVIDRLRWAAGRQLSAVYLLTTTAADFFARLGFQTIEHDEVPAEVRGSSEFSTLCPDSATVMVRQTGV
jgi:N-acetylglutamate synthase-like GNAT family acetyltransferase/DNA-binding MarR family transcriptional regulator